MFIISNKVPSEDVGGSAHLIILIIRLIQLWLQTVSLPPWTLLFSVICSPKKKHNIKYHHNVTTVYLSGHINQAVNEVNEKVIFCDHCSVTMRVANIVLHIIVIRVHIMTCVCWEGSMTERHCEKTLRWKEAEQLDDKFHLKNAWWTQDSELRIEIYQLDSGLTCTSKMPAVSSSSPPLQTFQTLAFCWTLGLLHCLNKGSIPRPHYPSTWQWASLRTCCSPPINKKKMKKTRWRHADAGSRKPTATCVEGIAVHVPRAMEY